MPRQSADYLRIAAAMLCVLPLTGCLFDYTDGSPLFAAQNRKPQTSRQEEDPAAEITTATTPPQIAATMTETLKTTTARTTTETAAETSAAENADALTAAGFQYEIIRDDDGTETASVTGFAEDKTFLAAVEIPDAPGGIPVTQISPDAFRSDHSIGLQTLILPASVTRIGENAFRDSYLRVLSLSARTEPLTFGDGAFYLTPQINTLSWTDCDVRLGKHCFTQCGMKSVTFSGDLTTDSECFQECTMLNAVTISDGKIWLGGFNFTQCPALTSVTFRNADLTLKTSLCMESAIRTLTIENCTGTVEGYLCAGCKWLENVEIGEGITDLGKYPFRDCPSLKTVRLPASLMQIDEDAFYGCGENFQIIAPAGSPAAQYAAEHGLDDEPVIPEEPFKLYDTEKDAYRDESYARPERMEFPEKACCGSSIESITFRNGVRLGQNCFDSCNKLEHVTFEKCEDAVFGDVCFSGCARLELVEMALTTGDIGAYCFSRNPKLETVRLCRGIKSIGAHAFSDCESLKAVRIPDKDTAIGKDAFSGCPDVVIYAPKGSPAISFAIENGYAFQYI